MFDKCGSCTLEGRVRIIITIRAFLFGQNNRLRCWNAAVRNVVVRNVVLMVTVVVAVVRGIVINNVAGTG